MEGYCSLSSTGRSKNQRKNRVKLKWKNLASTIWSIGKLVSLPIERDKIYEVAAAHVGKKKRVEEKVEGLSNLRDRKKVGY